MSDRVQGMGFKAYSMDIGVHNTLIVLNPSLSCGRFADSRRTNIISGHAGGYAILKNYRI